MGNSPTRPTLIRGSNNSNNSTTNAGVNTSNIMLYTNSLRNNLISRNLYTPNKVYPTSDKRSAQKVIDSVGSIINTIAPFKSFSLSDSLFGRALGTPTPLTTISTALLGKQLAYNSMSHLAQQVFPTIKIANLFDGAKNTHLFTPKVNFGITSRNASGFIRFLSATINNYSLSQYPFTKYSTNADFIKNSGTGQLTFLFQAMNKNIYKEGFNPYEYNDTVLTDISTTAQLPLTTRSTLVSANESSNYYHYFDYLSVSPYSTLIPPNNNGLINANEAMIYAMNNPNNSSIETQEYAPNLNFVEENFGTTKVVDKFQVSEEENSWIDKNAEFNNNIQNQIIWGRDGIVESANSNIDYLRGNFNDVQGSITAEGLQYPRNIVKFNAYSGLLEYTRNLLNASEGAVVDITRKAFTKGKNIVGFNGSALWVGSNKTYPMYQYGEIPLTGIRQHSLLDQYDKFAKVIRFNGNSVYQGNEDSVIYNSVLPRIHPTMDSKAKNGVNNTNLMFSIENLAVRVISKSNVGIIDDEYGSTIPVTEVGQFNGRMMWFPPYDISINESTSAKYEPTVMVGRNEPMYSHMYSERSATLTFTLLVDYPSNLKSIQYQGVDKHRAIAEFFAFGGDPYLQLTSEKDISKTEESLQKQKEELGGGQPTQSEQIKTGTEVLYYFPNDMPTSEQVNTIFDTLYYPMQYAIKKGYAFLRCGAGGVVGDINNSGVNEMKCAVGKTGTYEWMDANKTIFNPDFAHVEPGFSQYNSTDKTVALNALILNFQNKNYLDNAAIKIVGAASAPGTTGANKELGMRRAQAAQKLIESRMKVLKIDPTKVTFDLSSLGEEGATAPESANINSSGATKDRYVKISIIPKPTPPETKTNQPSQTDTETIEKINADLSTLNRSANQSSNLAGENTMVERGITNDAILNGYKSISKNNFYPVFHSQTPEEFHRRLTFLQQCMRQGAAKRYNVQSEDDSLTAKNSAFGRQPICVVRIGDFLFSKVIIENLTVDYSDAPWDMNPEGFGMQPMMAKVTLQMKIIGGQSMKGPVDALQNAVSFNYYANSSFSKSGMYYKPSAEADKQKSYTNGILAAEGNKLSAAFDTLEAQNIAAQNSPTSKKS